MSKSILILIIILLFSYLGFTQEEPIIYPGIGLGSLKFNESNIKDVESIYGMDYKKVEKLFSKDFADVTRNQTATFYKMTYKNKGLVFYFLIGLDGKENLIKIETEPPFKARTRTGIILGKSTFSDLNNKGGKKAWTYSKQNKRVSKMYKGIVYSSTVKGKIPPFNNKVYNDLYNNQAITFIKITPLNKPKNPGH